MNKMEQILPLIPLKDTVVFPQIPVPLSIGRKSSLAAANIASENFGDHVILVTQKDPDKEHLTFDDIYKVGTKARIIQSFFLHGGGMKLVVESLERVSILGITEQDRGIMATYEILPDIKPDSVKEKMQLPDLCDELIENFTIYSEISKTIHHDIISTLLVKKDPIYATHLVSSQLSSIDIAQKQLLLEETNILNRIKKLLVFIQKERVIIQTEQEVEQKIKAQIEKSQREYYLKEKIQTIQKELEIDGDKSEVTLFEEKIEDLNLSEEAKNKAKSELKKYKLMSPMSAEASVVRNYLDILLSMPWGTTEEKEIDLEKANAILQKEHYGLEKIKQRVIEHLAVLKRSNSIKSPILCLVGPPGVGKTSLAASIAKATNRKYVRCALGGVHDESEIRGHRRTYVGSMPGKIISAIRKAGSDNPVILLDEIDKIGKDFRGDPSFALLEVLDPEQNKEFVDNYLEVGYDLSKVIFIAAANSLNCPLALLDRMEIIHLSGYLDKEKMEIAKRHLIPKQIGHHKLQDGELKITDEAIKLLLLQYTKESGVRNLERQIEALARKALVKILNNKVTSVKITKSNIVEFLGPAKYHEDKLNDKSIIGTTVGLAYTEVGGSLLHIEAVLVPGEGKIKATGKLGNVMQESTQAAFSLFKSKAHTFKVKEELYKNHDIHLHVPEGAIPKDGPSAGITIFTTIVSLMTSTPVKQNVAMTGEITLRGKILTIGGLKEKLMAAKRGNMSTVLIPKDNMRDLHDIPESLTNKLSIIPIENAEEALKEALDKK
ncbi:endopeptidase La [Candidatus Sneabacter namystus]|uniref:Lon protease n=1 Tax=Candidatus Sneabacter namystus TaxID=2601646 RepID=A0A5C0UJL9_9RICK|nr:endopeptidase La [Candidatus Sneabacter namystus]QEK39713.1 endopeptidase La [Candidatus Sneabacter namystus]